MKKSLFLLAALALVSGHVLGEEAAPVDTTPKLAKGLLMKQGGKIVFAPCRDRSYAVVDDVSPGGALVKALDSIGLSAGKKLYVEVLGVTDGITLRANALNFARADGRCQPPANPGEAWRALGESPAWSLGNEDDQLQVRRAGRPDLLLTAALPRPEGDKYSRDISAAANRLAIRFERGLCRDKSGETLFGWMATVTVDGEALRGCAWER